MAQEVGVLHQHRADQLRAIEIAHLYAVGSGMLIITELIAQLQFQQRGGDAFIHAGSIDESHEFAAKMFSGQHIAQIPLGIVNGGGVIKAAQRLAGGFVAGDGSAKQSHSIAGSQPQLVFPNGSGYDLFVGHQAADGFQQIVLCAGTNIDQIIARKGQFAVFVAVYRYLEACIHQCPLQHGNIGIFAIKA